MAKTNEKRAEIKARTTDKVKREASDVYAHWGLTLNDAINMFLVKSIEVGGLPFELRTEHPTYEELRSVAYRAPLNEEGVAVLPADWDDDGE
ncbi:MAG: type II toxin-antitoxin system RelB/DinJ family antitoxin [Coriobacteriales bacterium]|jgi:DNA-damage-inducible protein J